MKDLVNILPHTGSLIRRAQQHHAAEWTRLVSSTITSVQFAALAILENSPGASQREVGDALEIDRSTIADLAARLERNGLLTRRPDPADRRRYILQLTSQGLQERSRLQPLVDALEESMTQGLSAAEVLELRRLLYAVLKIEQDQTQQPARQAG